MAVENDVAAFLELESTQQKHDGDGDEDGNNSTADTILRVFRMQPDAAVELTTSGGLLAVNAAPVIDHQSVVVSNRRVFFRARPHASAAEETFLVSTNLRGEPANGSTTEGVVVAADGQHIAFLSNATNLTDSSDGRLHVFVADADGAIERVDVGTDQFGHSLDDGAVQTFHPAVSGDGRFVVFADSQNNAFVRDRNPTAPRTERLNVSAVGVPGEGGVVGSVAFGHSPPFAAISDDGRYVAFASMESKLIPGGSASTFAMFVRDRSCVLDPSEPCSTERISQPPGNAAGPTMSADGRFLAFISSSFQINVHDRRSDGALKIVKSPRLFSLLPILSGDGRFLAFAALDDLGLRILGYHRSAGTVEDLVATDAFGQPLATNFTAVLDALSRDGRTVAFQYAGDVLRLDRLTHGTERVNPVTGANATSFSASVSADGRVTAYASTGNQDPFAAAAPSCGTTACQNVFVRTASGWPPGSRGTADDTVVHVLDTTAANPQAFPLQPAERAVVAGGSIAFIARSADHTVLLSRDGETAEDLGRSAFVAASGICVGGDEPGTACREAADCSGAGARCAVVDNPLAMGGFCVGGAKPGGACARDGDCADAGGTCRVTWIAALLRTDAQAASGGRGPPRRLPADRVERRDRIRRGHRRRRRLVGRVPQHPGRHASGSTTPSSTGSSTSENHRRPKISCWARRCLPSARGKTSRRAST